MLVTRHPSLVTRRRPAAAPSLRLQVSSLRPPRKASGFTLIELLIVIAIIAILASLAFPAVQGALKSARKAEARAMANQIKLAISSYYAEYGTYPTVTTADANFMRAMTMTNSADTNLPGIPNRRGIRFLEVPGKFTSTNGIVTPMGLYSVRTNQPVFQIRTDTNYSGRLNLGFTNINGSVAVWVVDPDDTKKQLGTW